MARRAQPINRVAAGLGLATTLLVAGFLIAPLVTLWLKTSGTAQLTSADWAAIRFSVIQATLSAILSVFVAVPVARALARRRFCGRRILITLLGAPFLLPVIVAVFGLFSIWGRSGFVSQWLMHFGGDRLSIYGMSGVVLAHVFFNAPLVTRLLLNGWTSIPSEHFRLAAQLGMSPKDVQVRLEIPMLRSILPGAFLLVFLLCITSFAVALALGGGPKSTTIELAIYQAVRFDFDLSKASLLGLIQFGICGVLAVIMLRVSVSSSLGSGINLSERRWDMHSKWLLWQDFGVLILISAFVATPITAVILRGLPNLLSLPKSTIPAATNSIIVAMTSAILALLLAVILASTIDYFKSRQSKFAHLSEGLGLLTLSMSPFVLGTGLFLLLFPVVDPFLIALPITATVNAMMSLPFALRAILPTLEQNRMAFGPLADSLDLAGFNRFRIVLWPAIRRPAGFAMGLSAALSMGDLGVVTLFAPPDVETLPLLMYRLMGAYRMDDAASVALVLVSLTLLIFWIFDLGGRQNAKTR